MLATFDCFMQGLNNGEYLPDVKFELMERDASGSIQTVKYKGAGLRQQIFVMVNNIPPFFKSNSVMVEIGQNGWNSCRKMWSICLEYEGVLAHSEVWNLHA